MDSTLPPDLQNFVNQRVVAGSYDSQDAVIRAAFALLEDRERLLARIDAGTAQLQSGQARVFSSDEELDEFFEEIKRTGRERKQP